MDKIRRWRTWCGAVEHTVRAHLVDPVLHRALSAAPPLGKLDWEAKLADRMAARVKAVFAARRSEIVAQDLDLAVYIVLRGVEAIVHNAATERLSDLQSGALTEEVTRMLVGYLAGKATQLGREFSIKSVSKSGQPPTEMGRLKKAMREREG